MEKIIYRKPYVIISEIEEEDVVCHSADTDYPFENPDTDYPFENPDTDYPFVEGQY